jgi:hypothetical protein
VIIVVIANLDSGIGKHGDIRRQSRGLSRHSTVRPLVSSRSAVPEGSTGTNSDTETVAAQGK